MKIELLACKVALSVAVALPMVAMSARADDKVTVVYAAGNEVVVNNTTNGLDYGYMLTPADTLKTEAGSVPVSALKPGAVITGGLQGGGKVVDDASVVSGTVVSVASPSKMVVKIEGENKEVMTGAPASAKVGDTVQLTLVSVRTDGDNRPMSAVKAPPMAGTLAFFQLPNLEQPDSGTNLPTYGLLGGLLLALGFGLKARRRNA